MNQVKVERFYCLKCARPVELVYLPGILPAAEAIFDSVKEAGLCAACADNKPVDKKYLH